MVKAAVATCRNHPAREALGVCVQCRTRICSECTTKVEGINYCVDCLSGLAAQGGRRPRKQSGESRWLLRSGALSYLLLLTLMVWVLLEVVLPRGA